MTDINRRKALKAFAWSVPVIAVSVATPLAAASTVPPRQAIKCERNPGKGQPTYSVFYDDGTVVAMHQGEVDRDKHLQALCRDKGPQS